MNLHLVMEVPMFVTLCYYSHKVYPRYNMSIDSKRERRKPCFATDTLPDPET